MELFLLWIWLSVNNVYTVLVFGSIVFIIAKLIQYVCRKDEYKTSYGEEEKQAKQWLKDNPLSKPFYKFFFVIALVTLAPCKSDIATMVAGSYAIDIYKSPEAAKLVTVIRGKANEILDQQIQELKK